jgi:hypothetical protein
MRRILLTFALLVITPSILMRPAQMQEQEKPPPDPAIYTPAGPTCKKKVRLSPWVGTPVGRCLLNIHVCGGRVDKYGLARRTGDCDDFRKVADALTDREICCDEDAADENQPTGDERPPERQCAPPTPWFGSPAGCKELKSPQVVITGGTVYIYMCSYAVFHYTVGHDEIFNEAYKAALITRLAARGLAQVCCDKFEDAVKTGKPCNPRLDVDCDGKPNSSDFTPDGTFPAIDGRFTEPSGTSLDALPGGLNLEAISPPDQCEGCRWELIKSELKCNPDPTKRHTYESTWRCPTTGKEVQVDRLSKPGAPCPF